MRQKQSKTSHNALQEDKATQPQRKVIRIFGREVIIAKYVFHHHVLLAFLILFVIFGIVAGSLYYSQVRKIQDTGIQVNPWNPTTILTAGNKDPESLKNLQQHEGRTNILLAGVDFRTNNPTYLTDTIILFSYHHERNEAIQISFPRDLYVSYELDGIARASKINSVFHEAVALHEDIDSGINPAFEALGGVLEDLTGLPLHYGVMVNFQAFKDVIDKIGGITVNVERSFTDYQFPNNTDSGYITVSFEEGEQTMDGETALQFARSRKAANEEGSDFARARRQQQVIEAIKEKIISSGLISQISLANELLSILSDNVRFYNVKDTDISYVLKSRDLLQNSTLGSFVLDPNFGSYVNQLLVEGNEQNNYIVTPRGGSYETVQETVQYYLSNSCLSIEDPQIALMWSGQSRYSDYSSAKQLFWDRYLDFTFYDQRQVIPVPVTPMPTTPLTVSPELPLSVTPVSPQPEEEESFGSLYTLNEDKQLCGDFYNQLFANHGKPLEVKSPEELPEELQEKLSDKDYLILLR
ncbi:MAG: LCP family protein [Candidatus Dojkabacteria bacterium]